MVLHGIPWDYINQVLRKKHTNVDLYNVGGIILTFNTCCTLLRGLQTLN